MNRTTIPINEIQVLDRIRLDYGEIDSLAQSIATYGLIQPLVLNQEKRLIAGGRRLAACQQLGLTSVDVVYKETLSVDELHEMELEENVRRKSMHWTEECLTIAKIHYIKRQRAALDSKTWGQRQTAEMFNISSGNVNYVLKVAQRLKEEQSQEVGERRFHSCDSISDAWKLIMRDEEAAARAELARRLQEQTNKEKLKTQELVNDFVAEVTTAKVVTTTNTDLERAHIDSLKQRARENYLNLNKKEAETLYLSNPLNPPDDFLKYYEYKCSLLTKHLTLQITNNFHCMDSITFMQDPKNASMFDHIITDIPYGIDMDNLNQSGTNGGEGQTFKDIDTVTAEHDVDSNKELIAKFFPAAYACTKPTAFVITWCDIMLWQYMYDCAIAAGFKVQRWPVTWIKTHRCMNQAAQYNFTKSTEIAIVCRKPSATLVKPIGDCVIAASNQAMRKLIDHPFAKPYEIWEYLTNAVSLEGQHILEPFSGRGSGVVSLLRMKRIVTGVELNTNHYNALLENVKNHYKNINPHYVFA